MSEESRQALGGVPAKLGSHGRLKQGDHQALMKAEQTPAIPDATSAIAVAFVKDLTPPSAPLPDRPISL